MNAGNKVGIYTTENRWGGPQFKRTGAATCKGGGGHSWYRWQPTPASEVDGEDPWLYRHECSVMGCDAKEYAADLPDLHDVLNLVAFLDQCGVPDNKEALLDRVRDFYNHCTDRLHRYMDKLGELPFIVDPREHPFQEGWKACLVFVVEGAAGVKHEAHGPMAAFQAFKRWAEEKRFPNPWPQDKAKPCPFCGGDAALDRVEHEPRVVDDLTTKFFYRCNSCASTGGWGRSETSALKMWNMR